MERTCSTGFRPRATLGGSAVVEADDPQAAGSLDFTADALAVGCKWSVEPGGWGSPLFPDGFIDLKASASVGGDFYKGDSSRDQAYGGGGFRFEGGVPLVLFGFQGGFGLDLLNTGLRLPISAGVFFGSDVRLGINAVVTPQWDVFDADQFKLSMGGNLSLTFTKF